MFSAEAASLPSVQRRLRHLTGVQLRNISGVDPTQSYLLYFTISTNGGVVYKSNVVTCFQNACWSVVNYPEWRQSVGSRGSACIIEVWIQEKAAAVHARKALIASPGFTLHKRYIIDLFALQFVGKSLAADSRLVRGPNRLVISLRDMWFSTLMEHSSVYEKFVRVDTTLVKQMYSITSLNRIVSLSSSIAQEQKRIEASHKAPPVNTIHLLQRKEELSSRLALLRKRLEQLTRSNAVQRSINSEKSQQISSHQIRNDQRLERLNGAINALNSNKQQHAEHAHLLRKVSHSVAMRQAAIVLELYSIYNIKPITTDLCSIMGVDLPNSSFSDCDDEAIAAALGYVAHLVVMVSKYLRLPLRFSITPRGSRSQIKDAVTDDKAKKYPLYPKAKERNAFEYGMFLLNKDVQQLLEHHGILVADLKATLPNIRRLMLHLFEFTRKYGHEITG